MGGRAEDALSDSRWSWASRAVLAAAVAVGAFLRFDRLGQPSYWLDEILGQLLTTSAAAQPWWRWLFGLDTEHGPLYYATQLATRVVGGDEWAGRLAAALFGCATIVLLWRAAREATTSTIAAASAALLVACAPLLVYASREARPYALLLMLTAAMLIALLRQAPVWVTSLLLLSILYTSAVAAPVVVAVAGTQFLLFAWQRRRRDLVLACIAAIAALLFLALYRSEPQPTPGTTFPAIDGELFATMLRAWTVSALGAAQRGRTVLSLALFAVVGAFALWWRDRRAAIVVIGMTLLPLASAVASLRLFGHWFAIRYISPGAIGFMVLAGAGVAAVAEVVTRPLGKFRNLARIVAFALALAICAMTARETWDAARRESLQKLDWRAIATTLRQHVWPGDVILAAEPWSEVSLRHYLGEVPGVQLVHMRGAGIAEVMANASRSAWLVTAGSSQDTSVRSWMCGYPLLLGSRLENFRLHYAPSAQSFLETRSRATEQRAAAAALGAKGFTLRMETADAVFLGEGWADAEAAGSDAFRWAMGARATVVFPRFGRRDRTIRFNALPLIDASLPAQSVRVSLNETMLATLTLPPEWRESAVEAPAALWKDGMNVVAFDFSRATAPASRNPASTDQRLLAAAFTTISVTDVNTSPQTVNRPLLPTLRLPADRFLDEKTLWRSTPTRFPPARLRPGAVQSLLGRLGYDPAATWPRLARGDVRLEDVVSTIASGSDCEDDATFLRRAFAILHERSPDAEAERDLLRRLREGASREAILERIAKSDEFRALMLR
jgi:hypothetical protein